MRRSPTSSPPSLGFAARHCLPSRSQLTLSAFTLAGASRGLGLGYARTLLESSPDVRIVAGVRDPSNANLLDDLAALPANQDRVRIVQFDVDSEDSIKQAAEQLLHDEFLDDGELDDGGLDALIVNAGVFVGGHKPPSELSFDDLRANFKTNVEGAILTVKYLLPLVRNRNTKQIFLVSSVVASFAGFYSETAAGVTCASFPCSRGAAVSTRAFLLLEARELTPRDLARQTR